MKEGQGKAVEGYLSDEYVFVYLLTRPELLRDPDRLREIKFGPFEEEQNDQVSSLQRKGIAANLYWQRKSIAANLHRPFYQLKACRVESSRRSMKDFWEECFYSLPFVTTSILNCYFINRALQN